MKNQYILGINSVYHDSAVALIKNGVLIAAVEEERFNRIKHAKKSKIDNSNEIPYASINYCLKEAGISLDEISYIGFSFKPERRLKNIGISKYSEKDSWGTKEGEKLFYKNTKSIPLEIEKHYGIKLKNKFVWVDHHLAHAASTFFVSPFKESPIVIVDGIGEVATAWLGYGKENKMYKIKEIMYPNSVGFLWEKMSEFLGLSAYDAGKVMGLASYGDWKVYIDNFHKIVDFNNKDIFTISNEVMRFRTDDFSKIEELFGVKKKESNTEFTKEHMNIAAAMQKITEKIILRLVSYTENKVKDKIKIKNLCTAGGVMLNCIANELIFLVKPYDDIFIPSAPNDAGTAIGSAFYIYNQILGNKRKFVYDHAYWGPEYKDNNKIEKLIKENGLEYKKVKEIEKTSAKLIAEGNIIAWFQGRLEFGPRALGNRSFLADPRRSDLREVMNVKVKLREWFRPFAPSITEEDEKDFFYFKKSLLSDRFMILSGIPQFPEIIPAVVHIDETCRTQTVNKKTNPKYHKLIKEFGKITGIPIVLNTSYNVQEPIICSPEEAIRTFLKTKIDFLVINEYLIWLPKSK